MADGANQAYGRTREMTEGPFRGWLSWYGEASGDPYETHVGPFCYKVEPDGRVLSAFIPERKHMNGAGAIHGGALLSFADFALFAIAHNTLKGGVSSVTLTLNSEFIAAGREGVIVTAEGEVLKQTRSLLFIRGLLIQETKPILAFSGTLKKLGQ